MQLPDRRYSTHDARPLHRPLERQQTHRTRNARHNTTEANRWASDEATRAQSQKQFDTTQGWERLKYAIARQNAARAPAAIPAILESIPGQESQNRKNRKGREAENAKAQRARLLALAEAERLPAGLVNGMDADDLAAWAWFAEQPDGDDDTLRKCLRTLAGGSRLR